MKRATFSLMILLTANLKMTTYPWELSRRYEGITKEEKVLHTVGRLEVEFWLLEFSHFVHRLWLGEILLEYEVEYDTRFDNPGDFAIFICWVDLFLWLITDSLSTQTTSPNGAIKQSRARLFQCELIYTRLSRIISPGIPYLPVIFNLENTASLLRF